MSEAFCAECPGRVAQADSACRLGGPRAFHTLKGLTRQIKPTCVQDGVYDMGEHMRVLHAVSTLARHLELKGVLIVVSWDAWCRRCPPGWLQLRRCVGWEVPRLSAQSMSWEDN